MTSFFEHCAKNTRNISALRVCSQHASHWNEHSSSQRFSAGPILVEVATIERHYVIGTWKVTSPRELLLIRTTSHPQHKNKYYKLLWVQSACPTHLLPLVFCRGLKIGFGSSVTWGHGIDAQTHNFVDSMSPTSLHYVYKWLKKGKFRPTAGYEGPEAEKRYSSTLSLTSVLDRVSGQRHTPTALPPPPEKRPSAHRVGGWVGPRAGLGGCGQSRSHRGSIPGPSSPYWVAIPITLSRPTQYGYTTYFVTNESLRNSVRFNTTHTSNLQDELKGKGGGTRRWLYYVWKYGPGHFEQDYVALHLCWP
jgi:hypothetical protein